MNSTKLFSKVSIIDAGPFSSTSHVLADDPWVVQALADGAHVYRQWDVYQGEDGKRFTVTTFENLDLL